MQAHWDHVVAWVTACLACCRRAIYMSRRNGTSAFVPVSACVAMGPGATWAPSLRNVSPRPRRPLERRCSWKTVSSPFCLIAREAKDRASFCLIIYRVVGSNHCMQVPPLCCCARPWQRAMPSHTTGADSPDLSTRLHGLGPLHFF